MRQSCRASVQEIHTLAPSFFQIIIDYLQFCTKDCSYNRLTKKSVAQFENILQIYDNPLINIGTFLPLYIYYITELKLCKQAFATNKSNN